MINARNFTQLVGRLGKDPELKHLESGNSVCNFSMATSEKYKKNGEIVEKTEWHNVVAWGKPAEIINEYVKKGDELLIQGKLTHRSYETDSGRKYITEVVVSNFLLMGRSKSNSSAHQPQATRSQGQEQAKNNMNPHDNQGQTVNSNETAFDEDDDLPF